MIASEVIKHAIERYKRVLFLAHRREIIQQTSGNGVRHGFIMAGVEPRPMEAVQVASIDTLLVRGVQSKAMELPPADEAHHARGRTREDLIGLYPDAIVLGMTATPCRGDGRGLGNVFDVMVEVPQVAELIAQGYLVPSRVYAPVGENIARGVRTSQGDYAIIVGSCARRCRHNSGARQFGENASTSNGGATSRHDEGCSPNG